MIWGDKPGRTGSAQLDNVTPDPSTAFDGSTTSSLRLDQPDPYTGEQNALPSTPLPLMPQRDVPTYACPTMRDVYLDHDYRGKPRPTSGTTCRSGPLQE